MTDEAARQEAERHHGIVNVSHRGILGGWVNYCSCGAGIIEPDDGHGATDAHLAGPPNPPRKPRTYRQGYADGKAWQAAQPVVVTAERVRAAWDAAERAYLDDDDLAGPPYPAAVWLAPPALEACLANLGITVTEEEA